MGLNITFWNCQGIRSKRKELELYLNENSIDIIALNETFLNKKVNFKIQGYDNIRNDRSTGSGGDVAFLVKHGLVVNKEFRNADFNIITDNEALAINLEFLATKTSLWLPFTAQMENQIFLFFRPSAIFPTMSCLLEILTRNQKHLDAPPKTTLVQYSKLSKTH